jgi:hypothetical protein
LSILKFIEKETKATKSYGSSRYCFEHIEVPKLDYDDNHQKNWSVKDYGETNPPKNSLNIQPFSNKLIEANVSPLFKYFLDGSRRTYKVDDIAYDNKIFPIVAGQIGIGCCKRLSPDSFQGEIIEMHNVLVVPQKAHADSYKPELYFNNLLSKINNLEKLKQLDIQFSNVLYYNKKDNEEKYENLAIAKIQDRMIELEKIVVANLTNKKLLSDNIYLIKDGSLEYKVMHTGDFKELSKIKNNYRHVIGVSKKFNPDLMLDKNNKPNASLLANLPLYHRTPAIKHKVEMVGDVYFSIWYLRIRDEKYSASPFDGIIKVEKILITDREIEHGLDSEEINNISAHLINERNPVCYGSDNRWANHLYPIHLTEKFIKSQYLSDVQFLNLF